MTGTEMGGAVFAATRIGCTVQELQERRAGGEKFCSRHREWHPVGEFNANRSRGDGLEASCRVGASEARAETREAAAARGANRQAANAAGVSVEEYLRWRKAGWKWCRACEQWQREGEFGARRGRRDGLTASCRTAERAVQAARPTSKPKPLVRVWPQLPVEQRTHVPQRQPVDLVVTRRDRAALRDGQHAACRDESPELFFPVGSSGPAEAQRATAKRICGRCPVRAACLAEALEQGEKYGVRGGLDEDERAGLTLASAEVAS